MKLEGDRAMKRSASPILMIVIATVLLLGTVLLLAVGAHTVLVKPRGGAFDFYWLWQGGRAILAGENPYGPDTTRAIQQGVYGGPLPATQYQHVFPYPAFAAFILIPFLLIPFPLAVSIWVALQIPMLALAMKLGMDVLGLRPSPVQGAGILFLAILGFRYPTIVLVLGQVTLFVIVCMVLSARLFKAGHPALAGVSLAFAMLRPDVALIGLLAFALVSRTFSSLLKISIGFLATILGLVLLPIAFVGFWPTQWLSALSTYSSNPNATWPLSLLGSPLLILGSLILLLAWMIRYVIRALRSRSANDMSLAISALVLVSLLISKQTGSYNLTYALIPAVILIKLVPRKGLRLLVAFTLLLPWAYLALNLSSARLDLLLVPVQFVLIQEIVFNIFLRSRSPRIEAHHDIVNNLES
jgi:hypothetical protein